ncbi:MAG TPA: hypothetical protein VIL47_07155 [Candidatus Bipolaricaulota bacterium]
MQTPEKRIALTLLAAWGLCWLGAPLAFGPVSEVATEQPMEFVGWFNALVSFQTQFSWKGTNMTGYIVFVIWPQGGHTQVSGPLASDEGSLSVPVEVDIPEFVPDGMGTLQVAALSSSCCPERLDSPRLEQIFGVDRTPPAIEISRPLPQETLLLHQSESARWTATDLLSGVDTVSATVPDAGPLDTSVVGSHLFEVMAVDQAGNVASRSTPYRVVYQFIGFTLVIDDSEPAVVVPALPEQTQEQIPQIRQADPLLIQFALADAGGGQVPSAVAHLALFQVSLTAQGEEELGSIPLPEGISDLFQFDQETGRYGFTLETAGLPLGLVEVQVLLDDGELKRTRLQLTS